MRVERVGADTRFEAIVSMMREALSQRPSARGWPTAGRRRSCGRCCCWRGCSLVVERDRPVARVWVAVAVLIVTCPCALSLAAPAALVAAAGGLARRGVLLQRLDALETLAKVEHVFFDKTGTLTDTRIDLHLVACSGLDGAGRPGLTPTAPRLRLASLVAASAVAALLAARPAARSDRRMPGMTSGSARPGPAGARCAGRNGGWRLGRAALVQGRGRRRARRAVWFGPDGGRTPLRLRRGAARGAADAVRACAPWPAGDAAVGRRAARVRAWPSAWVSTGWPRHAGAQAGALREAQSGTVAVAMVGDGINDAPVLARADVSLAMGQGALVARAQADAVVLSNRLGRCGARAGLARRTRRIVRSEPCVGGGSTTRPACRWRWWAGCRPGPPAWAWPAVRCWWWAIQCAGARAALSGDLRRGHPVPADPAVGGARARLIVGRVRLGAASRAVRRLEREGERILAGDER
jgi:Cu2+-exporting ATPase